MSDVLYNDVCSRMDVLIQLCEVRCGETNNFGSGVCNACEFHPVDDRKDIKKNMLNSLEGWAE